MYPEISVVLPVYNERETLELLASRLLPVLEEITAGAFEVIFVNDDSRDGSDEIINAFHEHDRRFKAIHFSRNFGHQAALQAGIDASTGAAVVLMDADLQDPPEVIKTFVEFWQKGYDVVYAVRRRRKERIWKKTAYALFYRTMKAIAEIDVPLDSGDFCLMDRRVVNTLIGLDERNRFLRGLRSWIGFKQIGVEYERNARYAGEPKYNLRKLVGLALSGYIGFSAAPLRLATWLGVAAAGAGFLISVWVIFTKVAGIYSPRGWTSIMAVILFIGGVQLLMLGVIGEYLSRVYDEVRQRPNYIIRSQVGIADHEKGEKTSNRPVFGGNP